nr:F-box/FBD/LRR-repeat protein At1g13570-like [Solanum lycopersicum]
MSISDKFCEFIIHKIFSYLSYEDAANSSLISKIWQQAWLTQPNLKFKVEYGKGNNNRKIVEKIMERYKDEKYPIDKFELDITSSPYHHALAFPRIDNWLDTALQNGVKDVVCEVNVPSYPFPISAFLISKSLRELVLTGCDIMSLLLSTSPMNCHSLRKLSLCDVRLDHHVLQTLLSCCPLISNLEIKNCSLLTKIELRNLQNIKSFHISPTDETLSVKIQALPLEHLSIFEQIVAFDIIECQNLKSLELSLLSISQESLENLIYTSQNLESLILYYVSGELNERFNIRSSPSLKVLRIEGCNDIGEIDASNLVSFEYDGYEIPDLKIVNESPLQLKKSQACLSLSMMDMEWFCKLKKFLLNLTSWSQVSLHIGECNDINLIDLELHPRVAIPKVLVLDIYMRYIDVSTCTNFVDALLWSCHPKILNLVSSIETIICFLDRLTYLKNSSYFTFDGSVFWHSYRLKEVKAFKYIAENEHVEVDREDLAMMTRTEMSKSFFLLDW